MRSLLFVTLLVSTAALAGWRSLGTVNGTFSDLQVVDAGAVLVASNIELVLLVAEADGGVTRANSIAGASTGGGVFGANCLAGTSGTNVVYSAGCGTARAVPNTPIAVRFVGGRLVVLTVSGSSYNMFSGPIATGPFSMGTGAWVSAGGTRMRVARINGVDVAVANNTAQAQYLVSLNGGSTAVVATSQSLTELSPFERIGNAALFGVGASGPVLHPDLSATTALAPTMPANFIARRVAMGRDVALLSSTTGQLASPIPDPANVALTWRLRPDAGFAVPNAAMHCLDSTWCAVIDSTSRVWLYENAAAPVAFVAPTTAVAGQTVTLTVDAGDPDGDPLFHAWSAGTPATGAVDGDSVNFTVPLDAGCGPLNLTVITRDGLNVISTPALISVGGGRGALDVSTPSGTPVAGGPAVSLQAFIDGGCESATFSWASSDGQSGSGDRFSYQPAATSCGGPVTVTLTATWGSGAPPTETRLVQFAPVPWGAPNTPAFPMGATQLTGTTQVWAATGVEHACSMTPGFPGTELLWDPIDAGVGVATVLDGGFLQLAVPPLCVDSRFVASARRQVVMEARGRVSAPATLEVALIANVAPLDAMTAYQVTAAKDGGELAGDTLVTATCLPQRTLESELTVFDGLVQVSSVRVPTPGPYALPLPGGCATRASLVARLFEDGGFTGATQTIPISLPAASPAIGELTPSVVKTTCGAGVRAQLTLEPVVGACQSAETSWRVLSGPSLRLAAGGGSTIDLQTTQLDLSMAGEQLVIEWSADAGPGNSATETRVVDIGVDPFVEVRARTTPLLRREESAFTFEITLTNTTDCAVDGLQLVVPLSQGTPLLETAQVDGVRADAQLQNDTLVLSNLALEARGQRVLRVAAKPKLLASPTVQPAVTLRGLPVSIDVAAPTPAGCGCSTTGPEWLLVALFAVARRRRRE